MINFSDLLVGIDFEINTVDGKRVRTINFDNAATTPPFRNILESIISLSNYYGSIGRGAGYKAEFTTNLYNESKEYILNFFNIKEKNKYTVIYVNNTTDGINKLSRTFKHKKDDVLLTTRMEHHSNDLPWRRRWKVDYVDVDILGRLRLDDLEKKLNHYKGKVRYVSVTGASNVTGYINKIHNIARIAHKYRAKIIIDGAQLVPHKKVDMWGECEEERIDFLVFSGHKLYAPFGGGAIVGLKEEFDNNLPDNDGGGTVEFVMDKEVKYLLSPEKDEAGTPNFFGSIAIAKSLSKLDEIGFETIGRIEEKLKNKLLDGLQCIPNIINYGDIINREDRLGIGVFNVGNVFHHDVAEILAKFYGISVRQGWFCAHPYCRRLMHMSEKTASAFIYNKNKKMPGMIRASFGIYNKEEEVDSFLNAIEDIAKK